MTDEQLADAIVERAEQFVTEYRDQYGSSHESALTLYLVAIRVAGLLATSLNIPIEQSIQGLLCMGNDEVH